MKFALQLAGVVALFSVGFAGAWLGLFFMDADTAIVSMRTDAAITVNNVSMALAKFDKIESQWLDTSEKEAQHLEDWTNNLDAMTDTFTATVERIDTSFNDQKTGVLPQLATAISTNSQDLHNTLAATTTSVQALAPIEKELQDTAHGMSLRANDPKLAILVGETAETMASAHVATAEWAGTSKDIHEAVHRATRPGAMAKALFNWVITKGGSLRSLIGK